MHIKLSAILVRIHLASCQSMLDQTFLTRPLLACRSGRRRSIAPPGARWRGARLVRARTRRCRASWARPSAARGPARRPGVGCTAPVSCHSHIRHTFLTQFYFGWVPSTSVCALPVYSDSVLFWLDFLTYKQLEMTYLEMRMYCSLFNTTY